MVGGERLAILLTRNFQSIGNVVVDTLWERVGFLKNHAHAFAKLNRIHIRCVDICAQDAYGTFGDPGPLNEIIHSIETTKQG